MCSRRAACCQQLATVIIRRIRRSEAGFLSELALRSKAYWGYTREFIEACRDELTVDEDHYENFFCAEQDDTLVGYYGMTPIDETRVELEALFVEPSAIGRGIGKALIQHAIATASGRGAKRMQIQGDPNATAFYVAAGARQVGERASGSIPGRRLPLFEIELKA